MNHFLEFSIAFVITALLLFPFLILTKKLGIGQHIRIEGPDMHTRKEGTPTMAGIVFIPVAVAVALFFDRSTPMLILGMATMGFWVIGLADGLIQTFLHRAKGLTGVEKLIFQFFVVIIAYFFIQQFNPHLYTFIPFTNIEWNLGWLYPILAFIFVAGMSNASNLTDGLDGLAGGIYLISSVGLLIFSVIKGLPLSMTLTLMGSTLAFIFYNIKPAKMFMGDVGSLALGGYVGIFAMLYGFELWMIILFPIFVIEAVSVIMQVTSVKLFKRKIFKMSPIHHHFELSNYSELQVAVGFWIAQALFTFITIGVILWILD